MAAIESEQACLEQEQLGKPLDWNADAADSLCGGEGGTRTLGVCAWGRAQSFMHPILIEFGDKFFIGTYGVMIAIGLMAAIWLAAWRGKRRGFHAEMFFDLAFVCVLSGFLSARLFYIGVEWKEFLASPGAILFSRTGFVFLGGFIGAVGCGIAYVRWKKLEVLPIGDVAAPSIALGHAFGRIGCHFAGCCWGGVCDVPGLGLTVHRHITQSGSGFGNAFEYQLLEDVIPPDAVQSLPVWPVQLMESAGLFLLCGVLVWFASKPRKPGQTLALYLMLYALLRFGLEFLRGDADRGMYFGGTISTSQILSLVMIPIGVVLWKYSLSQPISPHSHPGTAPEVPKDGEDKRRDSAR